MRQTQYERVLNRIVERTQRLRDKMGVDLKNAKPFDKEPVSDRERLLQWKMMPDTQRQMMMQHFPEQYGVIEMQMSELAERYQHG